MPAVNEVTDLTLDGDVAVITLDSPPVNALSFNVRDGLFEGFKAAIADPAAKAIVLICDGRTFIAGADISEFGGAAEGRQPVRRAGDDGELAQAGGRRDPRHRARRRPRGRAVRPLPHRRAEREVRPAGSQPRSAARRRRHAAPAAHRRAAPGAGDDDERQPRAGRRVPGDGPGRRTRRRGHAARRRDRLRPPHRRRGCPAGQDQRPPGRRRCRPTSSPPSAPPTPRSSAASRRRRRSSRPSRRR